MSALGWAILAAWAPLWLLLFLWIVLRDLARKPCRHQVTKAIYRIPGGSWVSIAYCPVCGKRIV